MQHKSRHTVVWDNSSDSHDQFTPQHTHTHTHQPSLPAPFSLCIHSYSLSLCHAAGLALSVKIADKAADVHTASESHSLCLSRSHTEIVGVLPTHARSHECCLTVSLSLSGFHLVAVSHSVSLSDSISIAFSRTMFLCPSLAPCESLSNCVDPVVSLPLPLSPYICLCFLPPTTVAVKESLPLSLCRSLRVSHGWTRQLEATMTLTIVLL